MKGNVLIVDDEFGVREAFRMILKGKHNLFIHSDGKDALESVRKNRIDVALLDIKMPEMSGIEVLEKIKTIDPDIQAIMVTGYATLDTAVEAMRLGAFDYIYKPFDKNKVEELVSAGVKKKTQIIRDKKELKHLGAIKKDLNERLKKTYSSTVESLLAAINAKDAYTSSHSEGVAEYAMLLLEGMNINMSLEDKGIFRYVCTLHDIGKIGISMQIIRKKGKLTEVECNEVKEHPKIGASVLEPIEFLKKFTPMVLYHHEHFDGKGYPEGKKGEDIPLWARILTVADAYHAMRSDRPYRFAINEDEAFEQLRIGAGSQFDPEVVKVALRVFKEAR